MAPCFHPCPTIICFPQVSHILSLYCFASSKGTWIKLKCHFDLQGPTVQLLLPSPASPPFTKRLPVHAQALLPSAPETHRPWSHLRALALAFPSPQDHLIMQVSAQVIFLQKGFSLTGYWNLPSHHPVILYHIILLLSQHFLLLKFLLLCTCLFSVSPVYKLHRTDHNFLIPCSTFRT